MNVTPNKTLKIPSALIESIKAQRTLLFLGAGASKGAVNAQGANPPSGDQLREMLALKFFNDPLTDHDLMSVAEMAISSHGQAVVFEHIKTMLDPFAPSSGHLLVPTFRWRRLVTTNYDLLLERAWQKQAKIALQSLVPFVKDDEPIEDRLQQQTNPVQYLKLHGCLNHLHDSSIPLILSHAHYDRYSKNRTRLFSRLEDLARESPIVFCGYRLGDAHIRSLIYRLVPPDKQRPTYYMVTPNLPDIDAAFWSKNNVEPIKATFDDFMSALDNEIPTHSRVLKFQDTILESPVRKYFSTNAIETELVRTSLTKDLTLVKSDISTPPQNPAKFYAGYDTGWGAIIQRLDIARKATEDVLFQAVLEESSENSQRLFVFRGPAGSGKTIALKRAGWEMANSLDAFTFWMEQSGALNPEVFSELYSNSAKRIYVLVDRLALHVEKVETLLRAMKQRNIPITIVAAERDAEWNVYCNHLQKAWKPVYCRVGNLSQGEIEALLDLLERHNSLGLLEEKNRDERIKAFLERADRQLLVALHEVTRGKPFEDIVFEEYKEIPVVGAQQLYLDVCTLNQFSVPVRAGTISRISGVSFGDYEREFFSPLENVILTGTDAYTGDYLYRARHSRVASLVFRLACDSDEAKVGQLIRVLQGLDIGYSVDRHALEKIIRGRVVAENIATIDSGRELFSAALKQAPSEAFVYQQRAILEMHHRNGSLFEAETFANKAREFEPKSSSIIHTQAEIARRQAYEETSDVVKVQLRKQSRARLGEIPQQQSTFVSSTRCKLLVDELEDLLKEKLDDTKGEVSLVEKIKEAEAALARAQQIFPDEPDIIQIEARLRSLLEQGPRALRALEKAWAAEPRGSGVAIRLSRAYSDSGDPVRSIKILVQALERNPDDKPAHMEIARCLLGTSDASLQQIEGHMMRSYDKGDNNFEARFLHAQFLFMIGKAEAYDKFLEIDQIAPEDFRTSFPLSHSPVSARLPRYDGVVKKKGSGYVFIKTGAYSEDIYGTDYRVSQSDWEAIRELSEVSFRVRFNRKGPVAFDIKLKGS